jgi:glycosyltransferase involved in cell wall biosynthesis
MKLVFLSHTAFGGAFVVGSHQLAKALALAGHEVTHVSAPLSLPQLGLLLREPVVRRRFQRWWRGGEVIDGVRHLAPMTLLPWHVARHTASLRGSYSRRILISPRQGLGSLELQNADVIILDDPRFVGLASLLVRGQLIYRATDLYAQMRRDPTLDDAERLVCEYADALIATSEPVASHLRQMIGRDVHVITNGVEFSHFAGTEFRPAATLLDKLPGTRDNRALYVGSFDRRLDSQVLAQTALEMPEKQFILVGPGGRAAAASMTLPNVYSPGAVNYGSLPILMRQCAVGLLPMSRDPSNDGRSPMKLYEYVAAGLPVAATGTVELRRVELPTLCLAPERGSFSAAVRQAFRYASDQSMLAAARTRAEGEDWSIKAQTLLRVAAPH